MPELPDPYQWPLAMGQLATPEPEQPPKPTVLRYQRNWDKKLFPVHAVFDKKRWPNDVYHIAITDDRMVHIVERKSDVTVAIYNAHAWNGFWYEYQDPQTGGWHKVESGMVILEADDARLS